MIPGNLKEIHYIERVSMDVTGRVQATQATDNGGAVRVFDSVDAAHRAADQMGGRDAGFRVMTKFVNASGEPCPMRITSDYTPAMFRS